MSSSNLGRRKEYLRRLLEHILEEYRSKIDQFTSYFVGLIFGIIFLVYELFKTPIQDLPSRKIPLASVSFL